MDTLSRIRLMQFSVSILSARKSFTSDFLPVASLALPANHQPIATPVFSALCSWLRYSTSRVGKHTNPPTWSPPEPFFHESTSRTPLPSPTLGTVRLGNLTVVPQFPRSNRGDCDWPISAISSWPEL